MYKEKYLKYKIKYLAMCDTLKKQIGGTVEFKVFYNDEEIILDDEDREDINTYQDVINFFINKQEINSKILDIVDKNNKKYTIRFDSMFKKIINDGDNIYLIPLKQNTVMNQYPDKIKLKTGTDNIRPITDNILGLDEQELSSIKKSILESDFRNFLGFFKGSKDGKCTGYDIDNRLLYDGNCKNGNVHGFGRLYYPNGNVKYEGNWENNMKNGNGILFYQSENKMYEGNWMNDKANGYGTRYDQNKNKISEGNLVNNMLTGKNTLFYTNGNKMYEGDMMNDMKNGKGILYYENNTKMYEGDMKDDKFDGNGISFFDNIKVYEGNMKNGMRNGNGISFYDNGNTEYNGEWVDNNPHGYGLLYYEIGTPQYDGNWENGMMKGNGKSFYEDGTIEYDGEWNDNNPL